MRVLLGGGDGLARGQVELDVERPTGPRLVLELLQLLRLNMGQSPSQLGTVEDRSGTCCIQQVRMPRMVLMALWESSYWRPRSSSSFLPNPSQ